MISHMNFCVALILQMTTTRMTILIARSDVSTAVTMMYHGVGPGAFLGKLQGQLSAQ